ncbi:hypothetical protein ACLIYN_25630, partial [Streptomyces atacamensis]
VNYRYAPDLTEEEALAHVREVFADCGVAEFEVDDSSGPARPGAPPRCPAAAPGGWPPSAVPPGGPGAGPGTMAG